MNFSLQPIAIVAALLLASCSSNGSGTGPDTSSTGTSGNTGGCSDAANCGAAGHSCLGGACSNCQCQAFAFYKDQDTSTWVDHLALDANNVYVGFGIADNPAAEHASCSTRPMIARVSRGDASATTVVPCDFLGGGRQWTRGITLDGGSIYWAPAVDWSVPAGLPGSLERVPIAGGQVELLGGQTYGVNIPADVTHVYSLSAGEGIVRRPIAGGPSEVVLAQGADALGLDDMFVYWIQSSSCPDDACDDHAVIGRVPKGGGATENVVAKVVAPDRTLWVNGGYVYFTRFDSLRTKPVIARAPTSGGAVEVFADGTEPVQMVFDATYATWTSSATYLKQGLFRAPLAGGPTELLAATDAPGDLVADDKAYYWNDATGTIWALAK